MNACPQSTVVLALLSITALAPAGIDSGGGKSSGGAVYNHSTIGEPFATPTTQGGSTKTHPGLIEVLYPITPASITDVNTNGLADGWEIANFETLGVDPELDADHDGTTNRMEYLAGTNPNNGTSVFRPQGSYADGIFQMPIQTVLGRNYKVWVSRNIQNWTLQSTIIGDGTVKTFQFDETTIASGPLYSASHPSSYFFRVEILIP